MNQKSTLDFWGIGAQRCGTTWLHKQLSSLPEFSLPPVKEFHYFDRDAKYPSPSKLKITSASARLSDISFLKRSIRTISNSLKKGKNEDAVFQTKWYFSDYNDEWYRSIFDGYTGVKGEITPSYSILEIEDIERMYKLSPNAKLIFMVRNPVQRAWSNYRYSKKKVKDFSLNEVTVQDILTYINGKGQSLRSNYIRTIDNFTSVFPKEQLLIGFYDAIVDDPQKLLSEITTFLGVDSIEVQGSDKVINKSRKMDCPDEVLSHLKSKYHDQMKSLAGRYGGYFRKWFEESFENKTTVTDATLRPTMQIQ